MVQRRLVGALFMGKREERIGRSGGDELGSMSRFVSFSSLTSLTVERVWRTVQRGGFTMGGFCVGMRGDV